MRFVLFISFIFSAGCTSLKQTGADVGPRYSESEYIEIFHKHTQSEKRYDGFYQLYEAHATLLNNEIQTAILQKQSDVYQWTQEKARLEREKMFQENSNSTKLILIMFTPNHRANDLHKGSSMWRVYLDVNGQRYEGKAMKRTGTLEDIRAIYPSHNRFSIPYEITFNVPLAVVENSSPKLTLTSALGTSLLNLK